MGQTYQSIAINAPAEKVWTAIRDFHDLSWAPNVITRVELVGGQKGDEVGAGRVLNDAFRETLREMKDEARSFAYSIDDGPSPVSKADVRNYVGRVSIRPVTEGGGTFVEWSSAWERNDEATSEFCHSIYVALLADMKKSLDSPLDQGDKPQ
jgi:hypothetical protein